MPVEGYVWIAREQRDFLRSCQILRIHLHIQPVPLPIPSHQELQITARNAKFHTCEVPTRKEVATGRIMNDVGIKWANAIIARWFTSHINRLGRCFWIIGANETKQPGIFGREALPLGRHIHLCLIQGSTPPPPPGSYHFACFLYMSSLVLFMLPPLPGCRFVLSSYVILSTCHVEVSAFHWWLFLLSCINNQQWKADTLLAVALCKLTVTNFEFLITLPDPL